MPSPWHDSVKAIFNENPGLAFELAGSLNGAALPPGTPTRPETPTFNDRPSTDFDADVVIVAGPKHDPVRAVIVEAQKRTFRDKPPAWARYAAQLWTFLRCPVDVLVICPDAKSAYFYAQPVPTNLPGYTHLPRVLLPSRVPVITDPDDAVANPAIAALSVAYHGTRPAVPEAVAEGYRKLPPVLASRYEEHAYNLSPLAVQRILEQLMNADTWPVYSPFAKEHFGKGKKEGKKEGKVENATENILVFLEARGLAVSETVSGRITACSDLRPLKKWVKRAATVEKAEDIFD